MPLNCSYNLRPQPKRAEQELTGPVMNIRKLLSDREFAAVTAGDNRAAAGIVAFGWLVITVTFIRLGTHLTAAENAPTAIGKRVLARC